MPNRSLAAKHERSIRQKREAGAKLAYQFAETYQEVRSRSDLREVSALADKLIHDPATTANVVLERREGKVARKVVMVQYRSPKRAKPAQAHSFSNFAPSLVKRADMRPGNRCL